MIDPELMAKIDKDGPWSERLGSNCWSWLGGKTKAGYGRHKKQYAHRLTYESEIGSIDSGLEIDHKCRNAGCVRPDHLEAVTHAENLRRSEPATRSMCKHGHARTPANVYVRKDGTIVCLECARVADRQRRGYSNQRGPYSGRKGLSKAKER